MTTACVWILLPFYICFILECLFALKGAEPSSLSVFSLENSAGLMKDTEEFSGFFLFASTFPCVQFFFHFNAQNKPSELNLN